MLSGKVNAALRLISGTESAGILPTSKQTIDLLKGKHPLGAPKYDDLLLYCPDNKSYEEYEYQGINSALIGVIQNVCSLKTSSFSPPTLSPLVHSCSFYIYPPQRTFALVSYPPLSKKVL